MQDTKEYHRLWAKAIQALARREYSVVELSAKLKTHTDEPEVARELVVDLVNDDHLNDERFCEMLCRYCFNKGVGPIRLRHKLDQHQIDGAVIETCLAQYDGQWLDRLIAIRTRKYGEDKPIDYKQWSRQARFLQQRGFSSELIRLAIDSAI